MRTDSPDCLECGTPLRGEYCHGCGQRRLGPRDRALPHLLGQVFETLTSLEGKAWRTARTFVLDTGELSRAYLEGRRQRYLKPVSVFLAVNLLFFVSPPISDFDLALADHLDQPLYGAWAQERVVERMAAEGVEAEKFTVRFEARSSAIAKSLVVLHVPLLALIPALLLRRRRLYFAEHVVVATHLFAFLLLYAQVLNSLAFPLLSTALELFPDGNLDRAFITARAVGVAALLLALVALSRALARAYQLHAAEGVALLIPWTLGLALAHGAYRFIQFGVVFLLA